MKEGLERNFIESIYAKRKVKKGDGNSVPRAPVRFSTKFVFLRVHLTIFSEVYLFQHHIFSEADMIQTW
jgi:hypothetical protein